MKKFISLMLILALSLALIVCTVSCKSCNDDKTELPGGVENPGGDFGGGNGDDNNDSGGNDVQGEWLPIG